MLNTEANKKTFFLSDNPSILDIYLCVMLRWMKLYPLDKTDWFSLENFKNLTRITQKLEMRPSVLIAAKEEGLGNTVFSKPSYANPPIGSSV